MEYIVGVDLGQMKDYTAVAIVQVVKAEGERPLLRLGFLSRFALGTPYTAIVRDISALMFRDPYRRKADLVVDCTGVGRAVVDLMRDAGLDPVPITITGGVNVTGEPWSPEGLGVPKRELVTSLNVALQAGRLRIQKDLAMAPVFVKEAMNFKYKLSPSGHDSYESVRESAHDDLILATSLAVWYSTFAGAQVQIFIG